LAVFAPKLGDGLISPNPPPWQSFGSFRFKARWRVVFFISPFLLFRANCGAKYAANNKSGEIKNPTRHLVLKLKLPKLGQGDGLGEINPSPSFGAKTAKTWQR
jgi:hypothetical protein